MMAQARGMSNYRRARVTGASYFFTVNLAARGGCLLTDRIDDLRAAFSVTMAERPFVCDAMVVLPDHIHAVWTLPKGDADFSTRWGAIKARFSMSLRRAGFTPPLVETQTQRMKMAMTGGVNPGLRKGQVGIWQKRFWEHCIRDERDYRNHVEYCWGNPVKHGLVERAADWPHSSIHHEIARGLVAPEWSGFGHKRTA